MRRYLIRPIEEIIDSYKQLSGNYGKISIIVITKNKYPYNFKPTLILDFLDVFKGEKGFIEKRHVQQIVKLFPKLKQSDTIIVGCDAGISRSPAVAAAIAKQLNDWTEWNTIKLRYWAMNQDVYNFIDTMADVV
jgi:predicted protein tyrosine phosphatase